MNTTIYSISESPHAAGQIWAGTDDGNLQLTRDGGRSWTNVTANMGLPRGNWISWVEASRHHPAVAYATNDRHMHGDMQPYLYRTSDYGQTWQRLVGPGTPGVRGYAHVIKEDPVNPNILFLGTEHGLFISVNGGRQLGPVQAQQLPRRGGGARHRDAAPRGRSGAGHPRPRHLGDRRHQPAAAADRRDPGIERQPASRRGRSSSASRAMAAGPRATPLSTARTRPAGRRSLTIKRRAT